MPRLINRAWPDSTAKFITTPRESSPLQIYPLLVFHPCLTLVKQPAYTVGGTRDRVSTFVTRQGVEAETGTENATEMMEDEREFR